MNIQTGPEMRSASVGQASHSFICETRDAGFYEISFDVQNWLGDISADFGLITLFMCHTSASLTIQENADLDVVLDLTDSLARLAPESRSYRHCSEGPDDMPAHIKSMLTSTSLSIPVQDGRATLGTWQGIFAIEHRQSAHKRKITAHYQGSFR